MISQHFQRSEFLCRGDDCSFDTVDAELLDILEDIRYTFAAPVKINSACRCAAHNRAIGGSPNSQHLLGKAADIVVQGYSPEKVYTYLDTRYPHKLGVGLYPGSFVHVDVRPTKARWNDRKGGAES
jgi:uncharacterized protein YcbK (DUF882 family)